MENTGRIRQALHALQVGADDTHSQEMSMVRKATNRLLKSNDEIIAEIENAIGLYAEGRWHIADKLAEAKALVGRLPAHQREFGRRVGISLAMLTRL